ncbi:FadR/GntR family transcriptional regulator [Pelagibacterium halotolerans]|uniref:FadR/GntR family transcriptional regulator n=1 Tax=Pelagibacterium halotolerans TaxID=531813 RepID=UPI0038511A13
MSDTTEAGGERAGRTGSAGRMRPRNFHSQVIWVLGTAIVQGEYPEGAILPGDSELTEQFGVSRTVLREALKTLSAKGLIEARARVGTRVLPRAHWNMFDPDVLAWHLESGLDIAFINRLAEVRMAVEPEAAALAAERRTPEHVEALMHWLGRMEQTGQSAEEFAHNDLEFHKVVAEASGNPFMVSLSAVVEVALTASFKVSSPVEGGEAFDRAVRMHRNIAEAIASGEPEVARMAMRQAIQSGVDRAQTTLATR